MTQRTDNPLKRSRKVEEPKNEDNKTDNQDDLPERPSKKHYTLQVTTPSSTSEPSDPQVVYEETKEHLEAEEVRPKDDDDIQDGLQASISEDVLAKNDSADHQRTKVAKQHLLPLHSAKEPLNSSTNTHHGQSVPSIGSNNDSLAEPSVESDNNSTDTSHTEYRTNAIVTNDKDHDKNVNIVMNTITNINNSTRKRSNSSSFNYPEDIEVSENNIPLPEYNTPHEPTSIHVCYDAYVVSNRLHCRHDTRDGVTELENDNEVHAH